ncbi:T9SS C-terminal target domain-containing protein [Aquimarina sp. AD10]|uniref:T9SS type A sorting domain-containing protein n=1 Tax=Aquimarina sp. AD10 TaxID=1714849 RepID=UPI000E4E4E15|nr:T9SS type A sorting domain-containing protein [Aquimarina sp. AD10]AXT62466.1 T9SS C-terminal target domain-containing protein [Aquimarina sp. AD10]RKM90339.1 T9SS C-terminal target domain-containing protein [Aquimarina sp. AD10]
MNFLKSILFLYVLLVVVEQSIAQTTVYSSANKHAKRSFDSNTNKQDLIIDKVTFKNVSPTLNIKTDYTVNLECIASSDREIAVSFWKNNIWLGSKIERISKGFHDKKITIKLYTEPALGNDYMYKAHIRPIGTDWQKALDTDQVKNISIETNEIRSLNDDMSDINVSQEDLKINTKHKIPYIITETTIKLSPNPARDIINIHNVKGASYIYVLDQQGREVLRTTVENNLKNKTLDISTLQDGFYFVAVDNRAIIKFLKT